MTELNEALLQCLEDMKAENILSLDVKSLTSMTDCMMIASGTSNRHVKAMSQKILDELKAAFGKPFGVEGLEAGEWVLIDYGHTIVHVMLPEIRDFYALEKLWSFK